MDKINLELDREQTDTLLRFLSLAIINIKINPENYSIVVKSLEKIHDKLDYLVHEVANWCDKPDCSYWTKKKKILEEKKKSN